MRFFLAIAAVLLAAGGGAGAAEFVSTKAGGLVDHDFGGAYGGLQVGGAWGGLQIDAPPSLSVATNAVFGGAHLGYNVVSGHVVAGVEAEVNGSSASGRFVYGALPGSYAQNLFGSADARLGWVSGQAMVFALAGYAWSTLEGRYAGAGVSASRSGYDVGGGLEYALTEHFSWRVEYRYYDFGRQDFGPFAARITDNVVRAGVSYRFGGI
ncbi:outer membrane immunogenic protein [Rhodoblastus acidophilus]|uniref:outer membrane protein n=1 Tax=Rhodoblastus acidophilus TaxID=1074 RepID=UPI0018B050FF|nr:outer membrane beta-barrel protein [Rhodoblastus acidophilus]MCW2274571.1 outer membrane immunogenic protein [Rhodoblastus acidophilus]